MYASSGIAFRNNCLEEEEEEEEEEKKRTGKTAV
jgi:hypothetical protein